MNTFHVLCFFLSFYFSISILGIVWFVKEIARQDEEFPLSVVMGFIFILFFTFPILVTFFLFCAWYFNRHKALVVAIHKHLSYEVPKNAHDVLEELIRHGDFTLPEKTNELHIAWAWARITFLLIIMTTEGFAEIELPKSDETKNRDPFFLKKDKENSKKRRKRGKRKRLPPIEYWNPYPQRM